MALVPLNIYYDGRPQTASGPEFQSVNPANGSVIASVRAATPDDISAAVRSAQKAFPHWAGTPPAERARVLRRAAELLRKRNDTLAMAETADTGRPFSETSTVDILSGADVLDYYAGVIAGGGLDGEHIPLRPEATAVTTREPLGVCAALGAWNYPLQIALWKSAPCLAAGNTLVYKPSEFTPTHALTLAHLYAEAGLPVGAFNVVHGAGDVGAALGAHPAVAKVSFTGQVSTGKKVAASAGSGLKPVTMELGGKSAVVVLPDAPIELAADVAMMANFYSTGQVCTNGTRVFVPDNLLPAFEKRLVERMPSVRAGDPADQTTVFGPLSSAPHREKVVGLIRQGIETDRARLLYGGPNPPPEVPAHLRSGYWVSPTVFSDVTDDMVIAKTEIFGPVASILPYPAADIDSAIARANGTPFGLAGGIVSADVAKATTYARRLEAGIVWVNAWGESPAEVSVGGWKESGIGVENGRAGLAGWTQSKSTIVDLAGQVTVFSKL